MLSDEQVRAELKRVNWNFDAALSHHGIHRLHWYPGTFIPQIPAILIELLSNVDAMVLDPFCGVGTTVVEALRLGRRAIGYDVNPVAAQIARAKTHLFSLTSLRKRYESLAEQISSIRSDSRQRVLFSDDPGDESSQGLVFRETLEKWYHPKTMRQMHALHVMVSKERGAFGQLASVVFSGISKRASSQHEHWGYVADNMVPKEMKFVDAGALYARELKNAVEGLESLLRSCGSTYSVGELNRRVRIEERDILGGLAGHQEVDLVVTSPPYPCVSDYVRSQRLSLWWKGVDVDSLREREIGARFKRKRKSWLASYFEQMEFSLGVIVKSVRREGHLCIVIGDSAFGSGTDVAKMICDALLELGCIEPFGRFSRQLSRQRLVARGEKESREWILIFRRR